MPERLPTSSRLLYRKFRKDGPRPESFIYGSNNRNAFRQAFVGERPGGGGGGGRAGGGNGPAERPKFDWKKTSFWLTRYIPQLRPYAAKLTLVVVLLLIVTGVGLFVPAACGLIIDNVFTHQTWQPWQLHTFGAIVVAVIVFGEIASILKDLLLRAISQRITFHYRQDLYEHTQRLPLRSIQDMKTGGIISRIMGDVDATSNLLQNGILSPVTNIVRIVATLAVLLIYIDWRLTLMAGIMIPILATLNLLWVRKVRPIHRDIGEDKAQISGRIGEVFGGIRVVRSFRRERSEAKQFGTKNDLVIRKTVFSQLWTQVVTIGWRIMIPVTTLAIAWYGASRVMSDPDAITVGKLLAFQAYMLNLLYPISQIVGDLSNLQGNIASLERVEGVLTMPTEPPDPPDAWPIRQVRHGLELRDVYFSYAADVPVLQGVSLTISAGTSLAVVGPSGAGKSTLADLIARFYDPSEGAILLDGVPVQRYRREDYRRLIAVVQQDTFLFDGTIAENIAYGRRNAGLDEIYDAARLAHCDEFIRSFPDGYESYVGERGIRLSGGQKQRIAIARAILADPQLLILDEATSSLDSESEAIIQDSLRTLMRGRTSLVIAHRLSTVQECTRIAVLEKGQITEIGNHDELMDRGGRYAEMVRLQRRENIDNLLAT